MNKSEYLFTQLSSECAEVIHRISKIQHFGLHETQPGQEENNEARFWAEFNDLMGSLRFLVQEGGLKNGIDDAATDRKIERIKYYMEYAREQGTLDD